MLFFPLFNKLLINFAPTCYYTSDPGLFPFLLFPFFAAWEYLHLTRFLRPVFWSTLFSVLNTNGIQCPSDDMIPNTGKVFDSTASNQNNRMLLKVVSHSRYIGRYFIAARQPNLATFLKSRIWFFRCCCINLTQTPLRWGELTNAALPLFSVSWLALCEPTDLSWASFLPKSSPMIHFLS